MASDAEILKEFLVSLGFQIQPASIRTFTNTLKSSDKLVAKLGSTVAGVAVAAEAMVTAFARQMENLYYVSRRTGASVKNLQAIRYGAEQIGVSAEEATDAIKALADSLKFNPGTIGVFARLTGHLPGKDNKTNLVDLARAINKMNAPDYIKAKYAGLFGMSVDQFLMFIKHIDEAEAAGAKLSAMYARAGVDQDAAAKAGVEYMNTLRELWAQVNVMAAGISNEMLPAFQKWTSLLLTGLEDLSAVRFTQLDFSIQNVKAAYKEWVDEVMDPKRNMKQFLTDQARSVYEFIRDHLPGGIVLKLGQAAIEHEKGKFGQGRFDPGTATGSRSSGGAISGGGTAAPPTTDRQKYEQWADAAADANNIPRAIFRSLIGLESAWNPNADANKNDPRSHAFGFTQLQPGTAAGLGVDARDPQQNINGGAAYLAQMYSKFGNWRDALAAYHEGPGGNLSKAYGSYADRILQSAGTAGGGGGAIALNQTNNITVNGVNPADANKIAAAIGSEVGRAASRITRDQAGATQ